MAPIKRILSPVDFSEDSRHAIDHAVAIARWYQASITALHVYNPMFTPVPGLPPPDKRVTEGELERVHAETLACFESARAIGVRNAADLMLFGSTTSQIVRRATCPVLTLRR